jgi:putative transposase
VCRRLGVSEQTFYRWKKQFAGLGLSELRELRSLGHENSKLKQVVADLTLDRHILRQDALRQRLRELAAARVRFGYRRLTVLLRLEGWRVNAKRIYRLYGLEGLEMRTQPRKKLASRVRVPLPAATRPNERWIMDFVSARLMVAMVDCAT